MLSRVLAEHRLGQSAVNSSQAGGLRRHCNVSLSPKVPRFAPNVLDTFTLTTSAFAPFPHHDTCPVISGTAPSRSRLLHMVKVIMEN